MKIRLQRTALWALALVIALGCAPVSEDLIAGEHAATPEPSNVILISWDGLDRSVVRELLDAGRLPNLASLIERGSFQEIEVVGHPTVTKPGHAEMLTGLGTEVTGVRSNSDFRPIPEGLTIFERVQENLGGAEQIRTFMIAGKVAHVGGRGPEEVREWRRQQREQRAANRRRRANRAVPRRADDTLIGEDEGEPYYLTRRHLDLFDAAQREASETGPLCLDALEQFRDPRFLAFLHFSDPDHAGHAHGIDSAEYREAAEACDHWLGEILGWLEDEGLRDTTLVYVTTDHGFDEHARTHSRAPHSWLVTTDTGVMREGIIADIPATILDRFGLDMNALEPPLIGAPLSRLTPQEGAGNVPAPPSTDQD